MNQKLPLIALMRHGQADNNVTRTLVGRRLESHLTKEGRKQVADAAKSLKGLPIDKIYASPVIRAVETASIVCEELGMTFEIEDRLQEIELGNLAGMNYEDVTKKHGNVFLKFYGDDPELEKYGVESFASVKRRVKQLLDDVVERHNDKNVLMVSHLDPIKAAISLILDLKPDALYNWHVYNASITVLKHQNKIYSLSGVNVMAIHRYHTE
jgi:probable phosphoglycerate mutase